MTHFLVAFDGSDDGYETLSLLVRQFDLSMPRRVTAVVMAWPLRDSPIWEKAVIRQSVVDDLHRAMAEVAAGALMRIRDLFPKSAVVDEVLGEGSPADRIVAIADREMPDLMLVGITGGRYRDAVLKIVGEVTARSRFPVVIANGRRPTPKD